MDFSTFSIVTLTLIRSLISHTAFLSSLIVNKPSKDCFHVSQTSFFLAPPPKLLFSYLHNFRQICPPLFTRHFFCYTYHSFSTSVFNGLYPSGYCLLPLCSHSSYALFTVITESASLFLHSFPFLKPVSTKICTERYF